MKVLLDLRRPIPGMKAFTAALFISDKEGQFGTPALSPKDIGKVYPYFKSFADLYFQVAKPSNLFADDILLVANEGVFQLIKAIAIDAELAPVPGGLLISFDIAPDED